MLMAQELTTVTHVHIGCEGPAMQAIASDRGESATLKASPGAVLGLPVLSTRSVRVHPLLYTLGVRNGRVSCATNQMPN